MKKATQTLSIILGAAMIFQFSGCYGNFALTRKLYAWNGQAGDKWVNSIVMFALLIVPVYEAAGFVDYVVLNTIQFWTGTNPVVMKAGEKEIKVVQWEGKEYKLTASQNRMDVQEVRDGKTLPATSLIFNTQTQSWTASNGKESNKIIEMVEGNSQIADLVYPDGHKQRVEISVN